MSAEQRKKTQVRDAGVAMTDGEGGRLQAAAEATGSPGSPDPADGPPPTPNPGRRPDARSFGWHGEPEDNNEDDAGAAVDDSTADDVVSPRQLALLASMVEEAVRTIPSPPPERDGAEEEAARSPSPPRTPSIRAGYGDEHADDDDDDDDDDDAGRWDRGPETVPVRGAYPDPMASLSPRPPAPRRRRRRRRSAASDSSNSGSSSASSASSSSSSSSASASSSDDDDDDAAANAADHDAGGALGEDDGAGVPAGAPPPPRPSPPKAATKAGAPARTPAATAGRLERRRARAAVAGRDATGRFTAGRPRRVELDADAASGAFYARYRDGYVSGEPWPGAGPPPPGRVLYGGLGDSRPGLWGAPEAEEARARFEASGAPAPVWAPELGDAAQQYALITRLLYTPDAEAMGWLQNPRVAPGDVALDQACFRISGAARNSSSFISGSVARAVPHLGYAMAAGRFGWGLAHVAAAVAMSRRYDRAQKGFLLTSLRRAYAPLLARENAALTGARTPDGRGGEDDGADADGAAGRPRASSPPADERAVPAGYGAAGVLAALGRLNTAPASAAAEDGGGGGGDDDAGRRAEAGRVAVECLAACRGILEALAEGFDGDLAAVPGLAGARPAGPPRPEGRPPPGPTTAPPHADAPRLRAWLRELRFVRDALVLMRLRGDLRVAGGSEAAVAAVRAVSLVAGALGPALPRSPRLLSSAAAAAADLLFQNQSLRPLLADTVAAADSLAAAAPREGRKRKSPAPARAPPGGAPRPPKKSRADAPAGAPRPASPAAGAEPPAPPPRPPRPAALTRRPAEGPDPRGGWRRQPPGPSHTPAPSAAALEAYCAPRAVAELTDHPLFPVPWRPALMFDPRALASLAARCAGAPPGGPATFGPLRASGPLRRAAAWMRQVPDPEDVRVVILYSPLPGEDLASGRAGGGPPPEWSAERGGLSCLLAALGNRLCGPDTAAWAGNWTGAPDVSALGAQGVLLLSTRDLAFAGAVEFLGLLAGASDRRLIVVNAVRAADWPADGPVVSRQHAYLACEVLPAVQCAVRWPAARDLRRTVLASGRVFGPGVFARVEDAHARLYPDAPPLRLCRGANVRYRVRTRFGPDTLVPMSPREYRRAVLPALDGRAAVSGAGDAMAPGAPDFCEDEAHSHRACARWGLGAPLRPVYVALGRDAVRGGPAELRGPRREFCARALLEPDGDAPPLVLRDDADAGPPPQIRWASATGRAGTVLAAAGGGVEVVGAAAGLATPPRREPVDMDAELEDDDGLFGE
ncbi:transcriptional regulator ICP4 [Chimpanzee herpesvirus strain 105640]|uniref:Transcriptional regulator ICP4 n=1 Tax=Chimpanzee herpesvirus strain 105640 TaxID=332937 RepID=K9MHE7_9ALPH|nr:transcriptional regulator ICP4 [Chimpanzee herpesvirus strain 105640]YP_009011061.1 transcriptional regulator ICP4 [Chimpanzee herpesvirus strain 105640]AFV26949.1 transcriptional regulator ICP4 [Chimpanzee herpesvirus strain 105640]AFV26963.1 transcriptional regulator ICP4 [Chimpanzee herpesvirus strain 105640]